MTSDLGVGYGEHRRADPQTSCDSAGSSDTGHHRTEPLFVTGNKTRDAALGEPRFRAGEIIGWRCWRLCNGLLNSVFVSYTWRPGVFERSSAKRYAEHLGHRPLGDNLVYHAFRVKEQAERDASWHGWYPAVIGSVAMWGEVIEHEQRRLFAMGQKRIYLDSFCDGHGRRGIAAGIGQYGAIASVARSGQTTVIEIVTMARRIDGALGRYRPT
jgi:hypothetical protein